MSQKSPWLRSERLAFVNSVLSALTLLTLAAMPLVAFHWLDPKLQELRHAPKLTVDEYEVRNGELRWYCLRMYNQGSTPAGGIKAVFMGALGYKLLANPHVYAMPPVPLDTREKDGRLIVILDRPIGPGQIATIVIGELKVPHGMKETCLQGSVFCDQGEVREIKHVLLPSQIGSANTP